MKNTIRAADAMRFAAIISVTALFAACASMEPPKEQMAASQTAVEQARLSGAAEGPASAEYNAARAKLDRAQAAFQAEDYVLAGRLAREAEVDAQLAQARATSSKSLQALAEVQAGTRALREEMYRSGSPAAVPTTNVR
ncbi:MAG TPA: DUF4398 domain-containing protein [Burkholderiales bacterium]|jgi:hypothetical protein|nr:DUF4398 domain-containing protein [Burkholderiales bacterium]